MAMRAGGRGWLRSVACALLCAALGACSLISLKSPEKPLSTRDLNARILTRQLSAQFIQSVGRCAQDIAGTEQEDAALLDNTLRWEIGSIASSRRAATQIAPLMSLLDTWALATQMQAFMGQGGGGETMFGTHQAAVRAVTDNYAEGAEGLAHRLLTAKEFDTYQKFVTGYVREHPLQDLNFARASVVELWSREQGADVKLVDSLGTIPEAMADASERLQIYGDTVPTQIERNAQLALREAGYSRSDVQGELKQLDERLERLTSVAESSPQLMHEAIDQVRQSLRDVLDHLDRSSAGATQALRQERIALFAEIQDERTALEADVDVQRKALAADAARIADQVVRTGGAQVRYLAGEVLLLLIVLAIVMLGLPFAAGYLVGRARARPAP
jgi:hypothetical protein